MRTLSISRRRTSPRDSCRRSRSVAFTLLELLLVLSLIVIMVTVAGLSLRSGLRTQRLQKAAEQVRLSWAEARVAAIKSGRVHAFYHAVDHNRYQVTPQQSLEDPIDGLDSNANGSDSQFGNATTGANPTDVGSRLTRQRSLPTGVHFVAADIQLDQRSALHINNSPDPMSFSQSSQPLPNGQTEEVAPDQWGMPIFFFPDGTSSSARLLLENDRQQMVSVYLRGLTGLARIGQIETETGLESPGVAR